MCGWIKRSHSIHMLNIHIDTKSIELVIYYQFNNIKLSFFASHMKRSFPLCTFIRYSRVMCWSQSLKLDSRDSFELFFEICNQTFVPVVFTITRKPSSDLLRRALLNRKVEKSSSLSFFSSYTFLCLSSAPFLDWEKKEITARKAISQNFLVGQKQH